MSEEKDKDKGSGLIFVACMFIGAGIGLAVGRPDVGGAVGMGVGFVLMALVRPKGEPIALRIPTSVSAYFLIALGIVMVVCGLGLAYFPDLLYPYLVSLFVILFGLGFVIMGGGMLKKGRDDQAGNDPRAGGSGTCCT